MLPKKIMKNMLSISLMTFYFSCGRNDILEDRTDRCTWRSQESWCGERVFHKPGNDKKVFGSIIEGGQALGRKEMICYFAFR